MGWYARVLQTGVIHQGERLTLLARPYPELTIKAVHQLLALPAKTLDARR